MVRLVSATSQQLESKWAPPQGLLITVAHANAAGQILLATAGAKLVLLRVTAQGQLAEEAVASLEFEVSCLNVTPVS